MSQLFLGINSVRSAPVINIIHPLFQLPWNWKNVMQKFLSSFYLSNSPTCQSLSLSLLSERENFYQVCLNTLTLVCPLPSSSTETSPILTSLQKSVNSLLVQFRPPEGGIQFKSSTFILSQLGNLWTCSVSQIRNLRTRCSHRDP